MLLLGTQVSKIHELKNSVLSLHEKSKKKSVNIQGLNLTCLLYYVFVSTRMPLEYQYLGFGTLR